MTTVKDVLEMGDITLDPDDAVSPSLKSKVTEATVVTINRADADVETSDTEIAFNEVRKETSSLPKGQEKVETEGQKGIMETTSLVKRAGDKVVSSNVFASWVKKAPVDKVILVGTGSTKSPSSADLGTTVPAGEVQSWAHQYLLDNGYSEADFTAANYIINHESGWSPTATNPTSGAYGLGQAYPGSKMLPPVRTGRPTTRPSSSGSSAIASSATAASSQRTTTGSLITITNCGHPGAPPLTARDSMSSAIMPRPLRRSSCA